MLRSGRIRFPGLAAVVFSAGLFGKKQEFETYEMNETEWMGKDAGWVDGWMSGKLDRQDQGPGQVE